MTEAKWLTCDDPDRMLRKLRGAHMARRMRLFACACCRRIESLLGEDGRRVVTAIEQFEDGRMTRNDMLDALAAAQQAETTATGPARLAARAAAMAWSHAEHARSAAAHATGNPYAERRHQTALLRDIVGNPFRGSPVDPAWLRSSGGCVEALARAIYDERRHADLPILADALEEAGCTNQDLLNHCRSGAGHAHGCWALDALLGIPIVLDWHATYTRTVTVDQPVEREARHIGQTSRRRQFAAVTLRLEPHRGPAPVFRNAASADPDVQKWVPAVEEGVLLFVSEQSERGIRLAGVRILLTGLRHHPVDSHPRDFETAAGLALTEALGLDGVA